MITMTIGGLWHGAGWTFVLWGALHGFYLAINHGWRALFKSNKKTKIGLFFAWLITFLAVVVSWVPFRAETIDGTKNILNGIMGVNGFVIPDRFLNTLNKLYGFGDYLLSIGVELGLTPLFKGNPEKIWVIVLLVMMMPNTQQFMGNYRPAFETYKVKIVKKEGLVSWRPTVLWSIIIMFMFIFSIHEMSNISEFLYFQF